MPAKSIDLVLDMKVSLAKKGKADMCDVLLVFDGIPSDWLDEGQSQSSRLIQSVVNG